MARTLQTIPTYMLPQTRRLPVLAALAITFARIVVIWDTRRRTRAHLATLDDRMLDDIGLTRAEAGREAARPFWSI